MEADEEMYEEHLDAEDSDGTEEHETSNNPHKNTTTITTTTEVHFTNLVPNSPALSTSSSSSSSSSKTSQSSSTSQARTAERARKMRKLVVMFANHLEDFQRTILLSRRRWQNRQRRRQAMLRTFFIQHMLEIETNFLQMLPLPGSFQQDKDSPHKNEHVEGETTTDDETGDGQSFRFYEDLVMGFNDEQWLFTFHITRQTFQWLCQQMAPAMPNNNNMTLEKSIGLALYAFATGDDYNSVGMLFNVSALIVDHMVQRFAQALLEKLGYCLLAMPKTKQEYDEIRAAFHRASNMPPLVVGILGTCELSAEPSESEENKMVTTMLQALVDDKLLFRKVRVQTNRITMLLDASSMEITKLEKQMVNDQRVPCFVVTPDTNYPLRTWMLHRYKTPVEPHEYDFNESVENLLQFKDQAFKRLLGRWKILNHKANMEPRALESIAVACCALHNLLEEAGDSYSLEWEADVDMTQFNFEVNRQIINSQPDAPEAVVLRDFLARTISSTEI